MSIALLHIYQRWDFVQSLRATPFAIAIQRQSTVENWYRHLYLESFWFCWFSRDIIKIQTRELLALPSFYSS